MSEKPEGFHEHHRQKRRGGDERPVNKLWVSPVMHDWIEKHPEEAMSLGWTVSQYEDPADVVVVIPDQVVKKTRKKSEAPRKRTTIGVKVPKDVLEDGEEVLTNLIELARDKLVNQMGWEGDVGYYYVLTTALHDWLTD